MENYINIVEELNEILIGDNVYSYDEFIYITNGQLHTIKFCDIVLWNSEMEEREQIEEDNDYEPLKPYLIKVYKEYVDTLNNYSKILTTNEK